ncbi:autotransporter assembly complex protein TamA [Hirschia baltica]|uniref:Surface antigen (D15) n=1 Tax=Hirschia baltica (strain ATCC 49814 / DSM 5838 / IFAM 1418) TaxID=582402 RepID=C6XPH6_HIRBI|nr:autotransporter assembly complex family protein [Hirschia baltica]ACT58462.1 surface antigen (D15) [Hirschia baltica ATCC 49814]
MKPTAIFFFASFVAFNASSNALAQNVELIGDGIEKSTKDEVALLLGEVEPTTSKFTARHQARRAAGIALDVLNSKGWLDASADIAVETGPPLKPIVRLDQGKRFTLGKIELKLSDAQIIQTDIPSFQIFTGDIARADTILNEEKRLLSQLRTSGYADASSQARQVIGDRKAATVDLTYNFTTGPKVCLGDITANNPGRTRENILHKLSPFKNGDTYSPDIIDQYKTRLSETQLYKYAKIDLSAPVETDNAEQCEVRDVLVTLEDASRRTVSAGASYATTEGFGLQAGYEMRNFSGRADTVNIDLYLSSLEQSLTTSWKQPLNGGYRHSLLVDAAIINEQTDAYDSRSISTNALYEHPWTKNIDVYAGIGLEVGQETQNDTELDFQIITGRGGARFDNTDNVLDPTQGVRLQVGAEPAYSLGDAEGQFITTTAQARGYTSFNEDKYILAGRLKVGGIAGSAVADIPSTRRFYAGGGGSVRGYEYQSIGPFDADGDPLGGRSLVEMSAEARIRFKNNLGMVAFVDAGEVGESQTPSFSNLRMGAGLGLRYYTSFGPLRLDVATPIDPRDSDERLLLYLSIGQAF